MAACVQISPDQKEPAQQYPDRRDKMRDRGEIGRGLIRKAGPAKRKVPDQQSRSGDGEAEQRSLDMRAWVSILIRKNVELGSNGHPCTYRRVPIAWKNAA